MLKVENLSVCYNGNIKAIKEINMEVNKGEIVVLIGANGAGKTTLLKALTGLVKHDNGTAKLDLSGLTDKRTLNRLAGPKMTDRLLEVYESSEAAFEKIADGHHKVEEMAVELFKKNNFLTRYKVRKLRDKYYRYTKADLLKVNAHEGIMYGVAHVPEGRQVFANLTVAENLSMGAFRRHNSSKIKQDLEEVFARFPRLEERKKQKAGTLSGGEQQMLAMARAMMSKPKILLLDEPSMGLSPIYVSEIFDIIKDLNKAGTTILLVEQNAKVALSIADRAYVLETGKVVMEGTGEELLSDPKVKEAYLGS